MRLFREFLPVMACVLLSTALCFGGSKEESGKKEKKEKRKEEQKRKQKGDAGAEKKVPDMIPIPKGHDSKGLKIPYSDEKGRLQMTFNIGTATRIDDDHVQMADLNIETFDEAGNSEMKIALPTSVLDTRTRIISSNQHVTIQRADFELTGESLEFNTQTKEGKLGGGVRMLIYNLSNETAANTDQPPRE